MCREHSCRRNWNLNTSAAIAFLPLISLIDCAQLWWSTSSCIWNKLLCSLELEGVGELLYFCFLRLFDSSQCFICNKKRKAYDIEMVKSLSSLKSFPSSLASAFCPGCCSSTLEPPEGMWWDSALHDTMQLWLSGSLLCLRYACYAMTQSRLESSLSYPCFCLAFFVLWLSDYLRFIMLYC